MLSSVNSGQFELPETWAQTSPVRFIDAPYSDEAFAEEEKTFIDVGPIVMDYNASEENHSGILKRGGELSTNILEATPAGLVEAHNLFLDAARVIVGEEKFASAEVGFTERRSRVEKGGSQIATRPHIDGAFRRQKPDEKQLILVGFASSEAPPILLNGGLEPESLTDDGRLISVRALFKRFTPEPIPASHLIITGPTMLHMSGKAEEAAVDKLFWRWHVKV